MKNDTPEVCQVTGPGRRGQLRRSRCDQCSLHPIIHGIASQWVFFKMDIPHYPSGEDSIIFETFGMGIKTQNKSKLPI
jgi:hypothetical protein